MRLATIIGRVTLGVRHSAYRGERLLLAQPWSADSISGKTGPGAAIVVYDELGANVGQVIAVSEGAEAARPFAQATPVDAYCAALIDHWVYHAQEPANRPPPDSVSLSK